ncbi:transposase [Nonomuraea sp. NPDC003709]|uniref:transposase n=1 Tax=Nonomuraea sp. NPDC003709 TaxID=3154450 RepID=UPI00339ED4BB
MALKDYSDEFRADAVALYESTPGATYKGIAADLGVSRGSLREWVLRARARRGEEPAGPTTSSATGRARPPTGASDEAAQRIAQLEARVRELEVIGLNRAGYYKWRASAGNRAASQAADAALAEQIRLVHADFDGCPVPETGAEGPDLVF